MATIIGGIATSHIPAIGNAIAKHKFEDPYWKSFFDSYEPVRAWLDEQKPDVAVVVYNDHGLNFFVDTMPTFAIGAALEYENLDEGWGLSTVPPFPGDVELSWHLIESIQSEGFDLTTCQRMAVDHGFVVPMQLLFPDRQPWPVRTVPLHVNTVQHPLATPARCYSLGQALGRALRAYPEDVRVVVLGTGGLSHQLDGQRAGFINKPFDLYCIEKIVDDPNELTRLTVHEIVRLAGTQGPELLLWLIMRGALSEKVIRRWADYHVPISNTGAGLLLLEPLEAVLADPS